MFLISVRSSKRLCHYNRIGCRAISTSPPVHDDKTDVVSSASDGSTEGAVTSLKDLADVEISQVALEAGSNSGLAFVGNNVMGAFKWVSGWLPSFGKSEVVWNDVVIPKLTHLYIPSIYECIQYYSGAPWFVVIGLGTLTLRTLLLPLSRRTMRMPLMMRDFVPKYQSYGAMAKVLTLNRQSEKAEKVMKWQQELAKTSKGGSTMVSFVASGLIMLSINRGLRHLAHLTPLMEGGFGPFLDMTVNNNASAGLYFLPLCVVSALATTLHMNLRNEKWYNPRLCVIAVPVGGLFTYFIAKISVAVCLHYSVSSWYTAALVITQHKNHELLKLPPPFKRRSPPEKMILSRNVPRHHQIVCASLDSPTDTKKSDLTANYPSGSSPSNFQHHEPKSDVEFLEELVGKQSEDTSKMSSGFETPYTPIFKLSQSSDDRAGALEDVEPSSEDNTPPPPPPPGMVKKAVGAAPKLQFRKRVRAWYFRQKLMRHGKKGNMSLFLEDAPPEMNFVQDSVQLTTKVTPGLKRYVLRRQYPMNTLEEMERKVSYIERVQNQRW